MTDRERQREEDRQKGETDKERQRKREIEIEKEIVKRKRAILKELLIDMKGLQKREIEKD